MGGLGSPAALYLAAAGVGTLLLADDDALHITNLQRQILYRTGDIGRSKAEAAQSELVAATYRLGGGLRATGLTNRLHAPIWCWIVATIWLPATPSISPECGGGQRLSAPARSGSTASR